MKIIKSAVFALVITGLCLAVFPAAAQIADVSGACGDLGISNCGNGVGALKGFLLTIANILLSLVGVVALGFLIWGAIQIIASAGDESRATAGRKAVLYAVVGLIIAAIAAIIVNFTLGAAGAGALGVPGGANLGGALLIIINVFLGLVGAIALGFLIWGAVQIIGSAGDESRVATGRKAILYAVVGLVVIMLSVIIINFTINLPLFGSSNTPECSDNIDNDQDGDVDYPADDECFNPVDNDEER